ncbi:MAG: type II toxin-antitoxin system MqsA family antitoxin [Armatimonadetes bacterium]|nr:type II toxin-antitoxin system MqsA family antitoxin [Armatimonadota bacterium]
MAGEECREIAVKTTWGGALASGIVRFALVTGTAWPGGRMCQAYQGKVRLLDGMTWPIICVNMQKRETTSEYHNGVRERKGIRNCDFCGGILRERRVDLEMKVKGRFRVFADTPAEVCEQCAMEYLSDATVERIDKAFFGRRLPKPVKYLRVPVYQLSGE